MQVGSPHPKKSLLSPKAAPPKSEATSGKTAQRTEPVAPSDSISLQAEPSRSSTPDLTSLKVKSLKAGLLSSTTLAGPMGPALKAGFVDGYLTPLEIKDRCDQLAKDFPHLVDLIDTGIDTHGYDGKNEAVRGPMNLRYLRLGPKTPDRDQKVGVYQYAAPHARERVNPMTMMEFAEQLVRNYDPTSQDPEVQEMTRMLDELDVYVAINTNPDGHNFAIYDDPKWRKNRAPVAKGQIGVDINRNYPYEWEPSDKPESLVYSGEAPASEAETQAILQVREKHPNIKFIVDWHSYGEEIRRPLNVTDKDNKVYDAMHTRVQESMEKVAGNRYSTVVSQVTKGTSDDHFYKVNDVYSTVMETGKEFIPDEKEALVVMRESVEGAKEYLEVAMDWKAGELINSSSQQ